MNSEHVRGLAIEDVDILDKQYIWIKQNVNLSLFVGLAVLQVCSYEKLQEQLLFGCVLYNHVQ